MVWKAVCPQGVHQEEKSFLLNHIMGSEEQSCPLIYFPASLAQSCFLSKCIIVLIIKKAIKKCDFFNEYIP